LGLSNESIGTLCNALDALNSSHSHEHPTQRYSFVENDLSISVLSARGLSKTAMEKVALERVTIEKYRNKSSKAVALVVDINSPNVIDTAIWLESEWVEIPEIEERIKAERPKLILPSGARKLGRNQPCFCGSGKKFKKCCINKAKS